MTLIRISECLFAHGLLVFLNVHLPLLFPHTVLTGKNKVKLDPALGAGLVGLSLQLLHSPPLAHTLETRDMAAVGEEAEVVLLHVDTTCQGLAARHGEGQLHVFLQGFKAKLSVLAPLGNIHRLQAEVLRPQKSCLGKNSATSIQSSGPTHVVRSWHLWAQTHSHSSPGMVQPHMTDSRL